jgi:hypothetical protein
MMSAPLTPQPQQQEETSPVELQCVPSFGVIDAKPRGMDDPDYARFFTRARIIAWQYGFALIAHGSFTRDLDLLMVPWEARAYDKIVPAVVNLIAQVTETTVKGEPSDKPHGRKAYTLFLPDMVRWVDLSVVPCLSAPPEGKPGGAEVEPTDAEFRRIMAMGESEVDSELRSLGIDPNAAATKLGKALDDMFAKSKVGSFACPMCGSRYPHSHTPE